MSVSDRTTCHYHTCFCCILQCRKSGTFTKNNLAPWQKLWEPHVRAQKMRGWLKAEARSCLQSASPSCDQSQAGKYQWGLKKGNQSWGCHIYYPQCQCFFMDINLSVEWEHSWKPAPSQSFRFTCWNSISGQSGRICHKHSTDVRPPCPEEKHWGQSADLIFQECGWR